MIGGIKNYVANRGEQYTGSYRDNRVGMNDERMAISLRSWDPPFWIGYRLFTAEDLVLIKETTRQFKRLSRRELFSTICENLPWKAPNGKLKLEVCRLLLEQLEAFCLIELPPQEESA